MYPDVFTQHDLMFALILITVLVLVSRFFLRTVFSFVFVLVLRTVLVWVVGLVAMGLVWSGLLGWSGYGLYGFC